MKSWNSIFNKTIYFLCLLLMSVCFSCSEKNGPKLLEIKKLDHYPSGSGLQYFNNSLYIAGDDAPWLMRTDSAFNTLDSFRLFDSEGRMPKETKADIESIAIVKANKKPLLILPGSGSLQPYRNTLIVIDPASGEKRSYRLDTFYNRLRNDGLTDLNIEGMASLPASTVLASRGNKSFTRNYLVITAQRFWENQETAPIRLVKVGIQADTTQFAGVSGLEYSPLTDQLLLTVSTENTSSSYEDGEIGKSYLWIINDISSKKRLNAINPDKIIDLEEVDARFRGHKIESVCIISETRGHREIALVSDNDKGATVLFRLRL